MTWKANLPVPMLVLLLLASCTAPATVGRLHFGVVADATTPAGAELQTFDHHGTAKDEEGPVSVELPLLKCEVRSTALGQDKYGYPGVTVELRSEDAQSFRTFTARIKGREMVVIVGSAVRFKAVVADELPGIAFLSGGFSTEEAMALEAAIRR